MLLSREQELRTDTVGSYMRVVGLTKYDTSFINVIEKPTTSRVSLTLLAGLWMEKASEYNRSDSVLHIDDCDETPYLLKVRGKNKEFTLSDLTDKGEICINRMGSEELTVLKAVVYSSCHENIWSIRLSSDLVNETVIISGVLEAVGSLNTHTPLRYRVGTVLID